MTLVERRDPSLWIGIDVNGAGYRYFGREGRGLEALTYNDKWYLHHGEDRDGCWLFRLPRWWQRGWKDKPLY